MPLIRTTPAVRSALLSSVSTSTYSSTSASTAASARVFTYGTRRYASSDGGAEAPSSSDKQRSAADGSSTGGGYGGGAAAAGSSDGRDNEGDKGGEGKQVAEEAKEANAGEGKEVKGGEGKEVKGGEERKARPMILDDKPPPPDVNEDVKRHNEELAAMHDRPLMKMGRATGKK